MDRVKRVLAQITLTGLTPTAGVFAQQPIEPAPTRCVDCHNGETDRPEYVPPHQAVANSVHAAVD